MHIVRFFVLFWCCLIQVDFTHILKGYFPVYLYTGAPVQRDDIGKYNSWVD